MSDITMTFPSSADDVAIATSIANHLAKPVVIGRADGTKHYVIPLDTVAIALTVQSPEADDAMRVYFNEDDGA